MAPDTVPARSARRLSFSSVDMSLDGPILGRLRETMAPILVVVSLAIFSIFSPGVLSAGNIGNLLGQMAPLGIVALGQMAVLVTRGFDISVGPVAALSGVVAVTVANALGPGGVVAAALVGLACGLVNGFIVGTLGIQPVIVTLGMLSFARGLALAVGGGNGVSFEGSNPLSGLGYGSVAGVPSGFLLAVALALGLTVLIRLTRSGRRMIMIGSDPEAAELVGVHRGRTLLLAYGLTGLSAGVAGLLFVARAGIGLPTEGYGLELASIAAAVIGGTALTGGVGRPWLVLIGAMFIQSLSNGLNLAGTSPFTQEVILGIVIVVAGLSSGLIARSGPGFKRRKQQPEEGGSFLRSESGPTGKEEQREE